MADKFPPAVCEVQDSKPDGARQGRREQSPSKPPSASRARRPDGQTDRFVPKPGQSPAGEPANGPQNGRGAPHGRQAFAAIDLGTNNCRLLIARPSGEDFTVIDAFSRVVRLGEGLAQSGRLSDEAMERAMGALHICADKLR